MSQGDLGRAVGMSHTKVGRIERNEYPAMTLPELMALLAVVGLRLFGRVYPHGSPQRDRAHTMLLGRLRSELHSSFDWRTEVPLPNPGDLRAWDSMVRGAGVRIGIEAETRPRDGQELKRRLMLKRRDGGVDHLILLLADTRTNRAFLREWAAAQEGDLPVPGRIALQALREGRDPGGSAVILL